MLRYRFISHSSSSGIRFDAAGNIDNDKFLMILTQQAREQARAR